jgi:hypothetical protein
VNEQSLEEKQNEVWRCFIPSASSFEIVICITVVPPYGYCPLFGRNYLQRESGWSNVFFTTVRTLPSTAFYQLCNHSASRPIRTGV